MIVMKRIPKGSGDQQRKVVLSGYGTNERDYLEPPGRIDFGWRLRGKTIRLLPDSSLTLLPGGQRTTAALLTE